MAPFIWLGLLLLNVVVLVTAPLLVALALPFARQDKANVFPAWLQWLNTPDDPGREQGMYEAAVASKAVWGWHFKTWYWLGVRNQCYGLFWMLAPRVTAAQTYSVSAGPYPRTKGPYRPGSWLGRATVGGISYFEFTAVWGWSATKCATFRIGWKLQPLLGNAGPIVFLFQFKPWITRDSTT